MDSIEQERLNYQIKKKIEDALNKRNYEEAAKLAVALAIVNIDVKQFVDELIRKIEIRYMNKNQDEKHYCPKCDERRTLVEWDPKRRYTKFSCGHEYTNFW